MGGEPAFTIVEHEPLARHTSWRIGGPARYYAEVASVAALQAALAWAYERALPVFILGGGTNLLVREAGFAGLVLRYVARQWSSTGADDDEHALLLVEAGAPMAGTVRRVCAQGWGGLEWAEGLPGTLGGAVFGNAGCYGGDIATLLERAWLLADGRVEQWPTERLGFGYRTSVLKAGVRSQESGVRSGSEAPIVVAAELRVHRADPRALAETMARIAAERKGKTPWGSSCGSVFKNPPGNSAGRLIEQAGLKSARVGGAEISPRHANYIVNLGGAGSDDVLRLIDMARAAVLQHFGVELELEVQVL